VAEERDRDVKFVAPHDTKTGADALEVLLLPRLDGVEHRLGQAQGEEEAQALIGPHASGVGHTDSSAVCVGSSPHNVLRRRGAMVVARQGRKERS